MKTIKNLQLTDEEYTELMTALGVRSAELTERAIAEKSGAMVYRKFAQMNADVQAKVKAATS